MQGRGLHWQGSASDGELNVDGDGVLENMEDEEDVETPTTGSDALLHHATDVRRRADATDGGERIAAQ